MQIAIISDIHDNIPNLTKVLNYCRDKKIEKIICCGDLASLETLDFLNDNFAGEIFFTFGNMDDDYLRNYPFENNQYKNTQIFKDFGEIEIEKNKIAFSHFPEIAKELCITGKYEFVFHGHTHKPWQEKLNNCILLNPGNVANQIFPPTFAVWDTSNNSFQLIRVNELK
jgi:putative phosphoesterase